MAVSAVVDCPPDGVIFEILRRCSINTMDVCKAVCKDWNQLIYEPNFIADYYEKSENLFGYLIQTVRSNKQEHGFASINRSDREFRFSTKSLKSKFDDVQIVASSMEGILCCVKRFGRQYRFYVCKPTTNQWQSLPNPKLRYFTRQIGFAVLSLRPLRYVIIRVSDPKYMRNDCYNYRFEMFDSQKWRWKELEEIVLPTGTCFKNQPAVVAGGYICCLINNDTVLAITTDGLIRHAFALPEPARRSSGLFYRRIIDYQGKLGVVCREKNIELWILEDWRNCCWQKIQEINVDLLVKKVPDPSPAGFYNAGVAFMTEFFSVMFYKWRDGSLDKVEFVDPRDIFPFRSDFLPVNLTGGRL